jgi:hypothetical protein
MQFIEVWKSYAPNFIAGIMTAILISIILGYNPSNIRWVKLSFWVIGLYLFGLILTYLLLLKFK